MHASYGLGAIIGPQLVTALLSDGLGWRRAYGLMALVLAALACVFTVTCRGWQESPRVCRAAEDKPGQRRRAASRRRPRPSPSPRSRPASSRGQASGGTSS